MGIDIDRVEFDTNDTIQFQHKLNEQLALLKNVIANPDFGQAPHSIGAELELYIVDDRGRPLPCNETILKKANNSLLTPELNAYNLEYNLAPCPITQQPFLSLEKAISDELKRLNHYAAEVGGRLVAIGILPTLTPEDFGPHSMTQRKRYHALVKQLIRQRGGDFKIDINGRDPITYNLADITLEGANTSFQIHYPVKPEDYADLYNSMQMMTPLALAVGANSPTLFGHQLWDETRIPLFKQSIDTRHIHRYQWNEPARVNFGHGWLRQGAYELFSESVQLYPPILPICAADNLAHNTKQLPSLDELQLHQGTVWLWNRPVYDHTAQGHLRIEMRALPSGPSAVDMMANAAFLIGLAEGNKHNINELLPALPFQTAEYNFYRAAQFSFDATLVWPNKNGGFQQRPILNIIEENLATAQSGLAAIGISEQEINYYLSVIQQRLEKKQNGAIWQKRSIEIFNRKLNKYESLHKTLEYFIYNSNSNIPVAEWKIGEKV